MFPRHIDSYWPWKPELWKYPLIPLLISWIDAHTNSQRDRFHLPVYSIAVELWRWKSLHAFLGKASSSMKTLRQRHHSLFFLPAELSSRQCDAVTNGCFDSDCTMLIHSLEVLQWCYSSCSSCQHAGKETDYWCCCHLWAQPTLGVSPRVWVYSKCTLLLLPILMHFIVLC